MNYRIVCDSSANLFSFQNADFKSVPLTILVEDQSFADDGLVNIKAMEEAMRNSKEKTGSSCPNIYQWQEAFEGADCIFVITITSALSGAYNAAVQAAEQYMQEHPEVKICVVDSLSTGPEMVLLAEKLAELFQENKDFETIRSEIAQYQHHTHLLYSLQSMRNLAKNGRINPAVAKVLGLLGIRIIGRASAEGTVELVDKCRGAKKANRIVIDELEKNGYNGRKVRIAHNDNLEDAGALKLEILAKYPFADVTIADCGALCSYYAEEHGFLIGYEDSLQ
jgi:DegV family protein with EDD domain